MYAVLLYPSNGIHNVRDKPCLFWIYHKFHVDSCDILAHSLQSCFTDIGTIYDCQKILEDKGEYNLSNLSAVPDPNKAQRVCMLLGTYYRFALNKACMNIAVGLCSCVVISYRNGFLIGPIKPLKHVEYQYIELVFVLRYTEWYNLYCLLVECDCMSCQWNRK